MPLVAAKSRLSLKRGEDGRHWGNRRRAQSDDLAYAESRATQA